MTPVDGEDVRQQRINEDDAGMETIEMDSVKDEQPSHTSHAEDKHEKPKFDYENRDPHNIHDAVKVNTLEQFRI